MIRGLEDSVNSRIRISEAGEGLGKGLAVIRELLPGVGGLINGFKVSHKVYFSFLRRGMNMWG